MALLVACTQATTDSTTAQTSAPPTTQPSPPTTTTTTVPAAPPAPADIVMRGGVVVTVDQDFTVAEGIAISDGVIVGVGSNTEMGAFIGSDTMVVELGGKTVIPGFVDPHTHRLQVHAPDVEAMKIAQEELIAGGTTTTGNPSVEPHHLAGFEALEAEGELVLRAHLYLNYNLVCGDLAESGYHLSRPFTQEPNSRLAIAGVKIFTDGGACNAPAMSVPYPDSVPADLRERFHDNGDLYVTDEEVARVMAEVDAAGGVTVIHAIGDRAIGVALDGAQQAYEASPFSRPHRIDHNSMTGLLTTDQLAIYGNAGLHPVLFAMPWSDACNTETSNLFTSLFPPEVLSILEDSTALREANPNLEMAWHGDAPSIDGEPLQQMFTLVSGGAIDLTTGSTCYPETWDYFPTVDVPEALRMMTINAAAAMGIGHAVGSLEVGKVADLLVLAEDPFQSDLEVGIAGNRPELTMIGGIVHHCDGDLCSGFVFGDPGARDPDGWVSVDHPVVAAVRASRELTPASDALDGDLEHGWVSGDSSPQWIEFDLGADVAIDRIRLLVDQDPPGFTIHHVYAGAHPEPGDLVATLEGETAIGDWLEVAIDKTARYIRVDTPDSPSWVAWYEIEIVVDDGAGAAGE